MKWLLSDYRCSLGVIAGVTVLFASLRLAGVVRWPWWVVFAPVWAPLAAGLLVLVASLWADEDWGKQKPQ
jgi:hypothetical protein